METHVVTAIQAIQAILAPAVGISAVGLLLLGLNNRYSAIISRIRQLNDEKRELNLKLVENNELTFSENSRLLSINQQAEELFERCKHVRNSILLMQSSVGLFVLTSVTIGLNLFIDTTAFQIVPLILFMFGMIAVVIGIVFAAIDIHQAYHVVLIEMRAEE